MLLWYWPLLPQPYCAAVSSLFFFQAEDGIRDADVTGVQTCALPIFMPRPDFPFPGYWLGVDGKIQVHMAQGGVPNSDLYRSEERRVGKECRSRWSPYH